MYQCLLSYKQLALLVFMALRPMIVPVLSNHIHLSKCLLKKSNEVLQILQRQNFKNKYPHHKKLFKKERELTQSK